MLLNTPIENIPLTSSATKRRLKSIGINNFWELLNYFPFRYENYSLISPIDRLQVGEIATIKGKILKVSNAFTKKGFNLQKISISDSSGKIDVNWFNQSYLLRILREGMSLSVAGEVKFFGNTKSFEPREYEILSDENLNQQFIHTARIIPVYSEKNGLSSRLLREKIFRLIMHLNVSRTQDSIPEILPPEIISFNNLPKEIDAYKQIHFPTNLENARKSRERLAFDELFTIQLSAQIVRKEWENEHVGNAFVVDKEKYDLFQRFISNLPFKLTSAQKRVVNEILLDLKQSKPMNRFLEGDVGSGKTVVAAIACYLTYLNGYQSLFMAPTEILANQHFQTLSSLFPTSGVGNTVLKPIETLPSVGLQTGSKKIGTSMQRPLQKRTSDDFDIIVGTHALITKKLKFDRVGLVIVDEQHRFGVVQRAQLKEKGINPHLLTMTATPIPRTVALTIFGELDLSVIDEMPKGRLQVKTFLVPKEKRKSGYEWIKKKIKEEKIQVFIICPLIEESEVETMKTIKAVTKEFERLKKDIFSEFKLGLLHGKVKTKEKEKIMQEFKDKKLDILVATSVVEVGIDIANATIIMIEGAERFGLAQLHQLRGRVGRGDKQSYCLLYTENANEKITERLQLFTRTQNGMQVAEHDLKLRGPGEIFGARQHGYLDLKVASLSDFELIDKSKKAVNYFFSKYSVSNFPEINNRLEEYKTKQISRD